MKVKVDQDKCIGCGACVAISEINFDFNEEGLSTVVDETVYDSTHDAVDACPVYAISIEEEEKVININDKKCKSNQNKENTCACGHCTCNESEKEAA